MSSDEFLRALEERELQEQLQDSALEARDAGEEAPDLTESESEGEVYYPEQARLPPSKSSLIKVLVSP